MIPETLTDKLRSGDWVDVAVLLLSLAGAVYVVGAAAEHGLSGRRDTMNYVSAARSLLAGDGFLRYDGGPMTQWPPGYSVLLAAAAWLGPALEAGVWIHAVLFAAVIAMTGRWLRQTGLPGPVVGLGTAAVLLGVPLSYAVVQGMSDLAFLTYEVAATLALGAFWRTDRQRWLVAAALLVAAAVMTRYVGVVLVGAGAAVLLSRASSWRDGVRNSVLYGLPAAVGIGSWTIRNWLVSDTVAGPRAVSRDTVLVNLWRVADSWSLWLFPDDVAAVVRVGGLAVAGAALAGGLWWAYRAEDRDETLAAWLWRMWGGAGVVSMVFVAAYVAFLVVITTEVAIGEIYSRFLLPTYVPLLVVGLKSAYVIGERWRPGGAKRILAVVLALGLLYPGALAVVRFHLFSTHGTGFASSAVWDDATVLQYVASNPPDGPVYSNAPHVLYFRLGVVSHLVRRTHYRSPTPVDDWKRYRRSVASPSGATVVWLSDARVGGLVQENFFSRKALLEAGHADTLATGRSGAVYRVRAVESERGERASE